MTSFLFEFIKNVTGIFFNNLRRYLITLLVQDMIMIKNVKIEKLVNLSAISNQHIINKI